MQSQQLVQILNVIHQVEPEAEVVTRAYDAGLHIGSGNLERYDPESRNLLYALGCVMNEENECWTVYP